MCKNYLPDELDREQQQAEGSDQAEAGTMNLLPGLANRRYYQTQFSRERPVL